ncbi:sensor histidine kinase [Microbacterium album]|uniref:histidine kinase n=1 Tax=Microbacterium album TaxID=2053191 RepID=A0A917II99_9MICO|nr:HAMP domain-containing sensor histidine kinase [Microbacterium album]GGH48657.1 two-component sensor histidine kinase [Microbacterium album]
MPARAPVPHRDVTRERTVLLNQLLLTGVVLFACLVMLLTGEYQDATALVIGFTGIMVISAFAVTVRWELLPSAATLAIPAADIVAIAFLQLGQPLGGLGLVWLFPVLWIAMNFTWAATAAAVLGTSAIYWSLVAGFTDGFELRAVMLPLTLASIAVFGQVIARRAAAQRALLARQSRVLQNALERARREEALVTEVLDAVDFGVIRIAPDGGLAVTNEAHARLQGDETTAAFHADGVTPLPPEDRPLARARRGETFEGAVIWYGAVGDDRRALHVTARRMRGGPAGEAGALVVSRDVTAELLALRARDDLVASVSHELRTPLTSILGFLELALDDPDLPPAARRNLEIADRNAERLLGIVSDILTASTDARAGVSLRRSETDVADILRHAVEAAAPRARERDISIDVSDVEPTTAFADPQRIRQVVDNLLSNAVRYGRHGGHIEVACANDEGDAVIAVSDDGPGISEAEQEHLFERFFRSDSVRTSSVHGSGLGLAICHDIVRAHGGDIAVQSRLGEGATFVVRLPAADPRGGGR